VKVSRERARFTDGVGVGDQDWRMTDDGARAGETMKRIPIYTSELYLEHDTGAHHPERRERLDSCLQALRADETLKDAIDWRQGRQATDEEIGRCHTKEHIQRVEAARGKAGGFDADTRFSERSVEAARRAAGSAVDAVERCWNGEISTAFSLARPPGHHATPDRAMGFCLYNSVAIAARHLRAIGCERVLIVDWDVHHGNGTQDIFWDDGSVFYYSLHQWPHYPGTGLSSEIGLRAGEGATLNRPLPAGYPAADHVELYRSDLISIAERFSPEFILLSAGFDSHRDDPLGDLLLDDDDFATLTRIATEVAPSGRIISVLEGGYDVDALARSVVRHVRTLHDAFSDDARRC